MKQGKSLQELAREIERQANAKRDYIANTKLLEMVNDGRGMAVSGVGNFGINELTHRQIADRVGIPAKYYDRMRQEAPILLTDNVNYWFQNKPEDRMIRTLDGNVRAFLSSRYKRLDNYELMEAVLPVLADIPQLEIKSCEITETRLYLKAVTRRIEAEIRLGDVVNAGIVITNSEVGLGAFKVEPLVYRLVCENGMIAADHSLQKYHVGRRISAEESAAMELYSDETLMADDRAFWLKARDIVKGALTETTFRNIVDGMREAAGHKITGDPHKAVLELSNRYGLTKDDSGGILRHLIEGGDLSKLGLINAVTRHSQDEQNYDRATELERLGGKVLMLNGRDWKAIAEAA
ncbi:MAG: DUF945 domain-containing protein [Peptococcaceae bacterium]|nr:DUF945 domain-containing protein [Peptococcaceae bacterium]